MRFILTLRALQQLNKLDAIQKERIVSKLEFFAAQADPLVFATHITGHNLYRFRVGSWRIIFEIEGDRLYVEVIARRDQIYKDI